MGEGIYMEVIININNLQYEVKKDSFLFNDLCMYIEKNKITCISGSNNCGKTTLFKILSRENTLPKSTIIIDGKDKMDYSRQEYREMVQAVFPHKLLKNEENVFDYLCKQASTINMEKIEFVLEELNLMSKKDKEIDKLDEIDHIKIQLAAAIIKSNKIILIDCLDSYLELSEIKKIYNFLRKCMKKYDLTFVTTTHNLEEALYSDELYIIKSGGIILHGDPLTVLSKDNIINKAGLRLPFMIDLSVKLKDYDLIKSIELKPERLINDLWK